MAKTQNDIITSLITALQNGEGGLDDLENLLDRVKSDVADAKKAEAEAAEKAKAQKEAEFAKRGQEIANMATRVLEDKATSADVAMVFEAFLKAQGHKDVKVSAKDIEESMNAADEMAKHIEDVFSTIGDIFGIKPEVNKETVVKAKPAQKVDADEVLRKFLAGLR